MIFPNVIHFIDLFEYNLVLKELFIALHSNSCFPLLYLNYEYLLFVCLFVCLFLF